MLFFCNNVVATETAGFDVSDYEPNMVVGTTQTIYVTVYPEETEDKPIYESSNNEIAEISQGGKITAKKKGTANIIITVGGKKKALPLTVIIETEKITLNSQYVMMKKGQDFQIKAVVMPQNANQKLTYKSTDEDVAKVDTKGVVTGLKSGTASIIVSNDRLSTSVTIIVNKNVNFTNSLENHSIDIPELVLEKETLENKIINGNSKELHLYAFETILINKNVLGALQKTEKRLVVKADEYDITISGEDIINCENVLVGGITLKKAKNGTKVVVNDGKPLPGKIQIRIKDIDTKGFKYVYIKDNINNKYKFLDAKEKENVFSVDIAGEYYLAFEKLNQFSIEIWHIIIVMLLLVSTICVYIIVKRRYFFW